VVVLLGASGCGGLAVQRTKRLKIALGRENVESNLTFNDVTLERADEQGRSVWKVKAEATYSKDKEKLLKFKPTGELFKIAGLPNHGNEERSSRMASSCCFSRVDSRSRNGLVLRGNG